MNERDMEAVEKVLSKGVHPWTIRTRSLNPVYQRTVCPWCAGQFVKWAGHYKTCKGLGSVTRAAITALDKARAERGIKPMPREPTEGMVDAMWRAFRDAAISHMKVTWKSAHDAYGGGEKKG